MVERELSDLDNPGKRSASRLARLQPWSDILVGAALLLAGLKFTHGLETGVDIDVYDGAVYLHRGLDLFRSPFHAASASPLYTAWYFVLSRFIPRPVDLFYLNFRLLTILLPLAAFVLLRACRVPTFTTAIASWVLLVSRGNAPTIPKSPHLALLLAFVTLVAAVRMRSLFWSSLVCSCGALLLSYVRPEYFVAYALSSALLLAAAFRVTRSTGNRRALSRPLLVLAFFLVISIALFAALGLPVAGARSFLAFGQHFSNHWVHWTGSSENPWTDWRQITAKEFGSARSLEGALVANPGMFLRHVGTNLVQAPEVALPLLVPVVFPADLSSIILVALLVVGLCAMGRQNLKRNLSSQRNLLAFSGILVLPDVISVVVIYPRAHYFVAPLALAALCLVALLGDLQPADRARSNSKSWARAALISMMLLAFSPYLADQVAEKKPNLRTVHLIESLDIHGPVNLLETGHYDVYLGNNFHRVPQFSKTTNFRTFMMRNDINMVVVSLDLREDTRFDRDPQWLAFSRHPALFGYLKIRVPRTGRLLLVKESLLHHGQKASWRPLSIGTERFATAVICAGAPRGRSAAASGRAR